MQVDFLDRFSRGTSLLHRLDARAKLLLALGLVAFVIATPELVGLVFDEPWPCWFFYAVEAWSVLAIYTLARLPWRYLALRLLAMLPFLLLLALAFPLTHSFEKGWNEAAGLLAR
ncbi:MAG: hypothetical protein HY000_36485 [Planctomycetes bacterium]|nr:hypothetical protein [Planctomycetota bacterium]